MKIFPAIDIIGGKVVRLLRGDYGKVTEYSVTVAEAARRFRADGADCLHVVDLDGAKSGNCDNAQCIKSVISNTRMFVEVGGGIRSERQIENYLEAGAGRVILGTVAVKDFKFVERAVARYGDKIAVGVDAAGGKAAVNGWREVTETDALSFCEKLADAGVKSVIYTDISRDGAMGGADLDIYGRLVGIKGLQITASGGVTYIDEIKKLRDIGVEAVILGRSLYEGRIDLKAAIAAAEG